MAKDFRDFILKCLRLMLRPIVSFCVSRGIKFRDFSEVSKKLFVLSAQEELSSKNTPISVGRLSLMTGLQRPEIKRLQKSVSSWEIPAQDLIVRIVGQWASDKRFQETSGVPRPLFTEGKKGDFAKLVASVSRDLNPHTVRFELERLGLVAHIDSHAHLLSSSRIATGEIEKSLEFLSSDVRDLIRAGEENAFGEHLVPNLHATTSYDNISDEQLPKIKRWMLELGQRIHEECRTFLSKFDRDINPKDGDEGIGRNRISFGTFSYSEKSVVSKSKASTTKRQS